MKRTVSTLFLKANQKRKSAKQLPYFLFDTKEAEGEKKLNLVLLVGKTSTV